MAKTSIPALGLVEKTTCALRRRIVAGTYGTDGELPPQGELCDELGVSRSVLREAMQRLQSQRLIEIGQGRKPRVVPPGPEALAESLQMLVDRTKATWSHLGEVRLTLEVEIAARAAEHVTQRDLRELEKAIAAMQATDVLAEQVAADMRFHRLLAEATDNPIYAFLLDALSALLRASRERTIGKGGVAPALRGHGSILDAIRQRDPELARAAMAEHLKESQRDLEQLS